MTATGTALSRRAFAARAGAAALPLILGARTRAEPPGRRVAVGMIGVGRQGTLTNLRQFLAMDDVQVVAVCDVDRWRRDNARQLVDAHYAAQSSSGSARGCGAHHDFRELIARPDIDAVMISTPDHWHVPMALLAMKAGKDVSCEKPLTLSIQEGRLLADAARKHGRVFRTDSEFRSSNSARKACELVRNGRIGRLHTIRTGTPQEGAIPPAAGPQPVPEELDYELWLGPAPEAPYTEMRVHPRHEVAARPGWIRVRDYSEGMITNWGTHLNDLAQWANDTDRTGPVEVEARGKYPPDGTLWNVLIGFEAEYRYANGVKLHYRMDKPYVRFEGDGGWLEFQYGRGLLASDKQLISAPAQPGDIKLPGLGDKEDFIQAVKSRGPTMADAEVGHRTTSLCQIAHIAIQLGGRKLRWDPAAERFPDDEAANRLLRRPGWRGDWMKEFLPAGAG